MSYEVKLTTEGRGGWVYYTELGETLPFDWDITTVGFDIYLPSQAEWEAFCEEHNAINAKSRRDEIVQRLAQEVARQRAKRAKVTIDDTGISFSYEGSWLRLLLRKILGLD